MVGAGWSCAAAAAANTLEWATGKAGSDCAGKASQRSLGTSCTAWSEGMSLHPWGTARRRITGTSRKAERKPREPLCVHRDRQPHKGILDLSNFCIKTGNCPSLRQSRGRAAWLASVSPRKGRRKEQTAPFLLSRSVSERGCISSFVPGILLSLSPGQVLENSEKISELRADRLRPLLTPISSRRSRVGDWYKRQGRDASPKHPGNFKWGFWFKFSLGFGQLNPSATLSEGW